MGPKRQKERGERGRRGKREKLGERLSGSERAKRKR